MAMNITMNWKKHITIEVEAPNPLSIKEAGIVSSIIFGVAQSRTPEENPKMSLPKHMTL